MFLNISSGSDAMFHLFEAILFTDSPCLQYAEKTNLKMKTFLNAFDHYHVNKSCLNIRNGLIIQCFSLEFLSIEMKCFSTNYKCAFFPRKCINFNANIRCAAERLIKIIQLKSPIWNEWQLKFSMAKSAIGCNLFACCRRTKFNIKS